MVLRHPRCLHRPTVQYRLTGFILFQKSHARNGKSRTKKRLPVNTGNGARHGECAGWKYLRESGAAMYDSA